MPHGTVNHQQPQAGLKFLRDARVVNRVKSSRVERGTTARARSSSLSYKGGALPPEMFGYSKHEALGQSLDELVTPAALFSETNKNPSRPRNVGDDRIACNAVAPEFIKHG